MPPQDTLSVESIIQSLTEFVGDNPDRAKEVAKALLRDSTLSPITDHLKRKGANETQGERTKLTQKITELDGRLALMTEQMEEKDAALEEMKSAAPDWKRRIEEQERKHAEARQKLTDDLSTERQGRRQDRLEMYQQQFMTFLAPALADEDYATYTAGPKYKQNIKLDDEGKLIVLEPGEGVPYELPAGVEPSKAVAQVLKKLATDALHEIPSKYKLAPQSHAGAGVTSLTDTAPRPKTPDQVRESLRSQVGYATP